MQIVKPAYFFFLFEILFFYSEFLMLCSSLLVNEKFPQQKKKKKKEKEKEKEKKRKFLFILKNI
jgi:membrane-anchored glycerophosphoryl diester phosphodiesterase (GDPDase)